MHSGFHSLPNEILYKIKDCIKDSDLRTHVCFYNTCTRVAALYNDGGEAKGEAFWHRCCQLAGLGRGPADQYIPWKRFAFDVISEDGFCSHPCCGSALLEYNASKMEEAIHRCSNTWSNAMIPASTALAPADLHPHQLLRFISFSERGRPHLRRSTSPTDPSWLSEHALPRRSFATFPPTDFMKLTIINNRTSWYLAQETGLAVADIVGMVQQQWHAETSPADLYELLCGPYIEYVPKDWTILDILSRLQIYGKIFELARWDGLDFDEVERGFRVRFEHLTQDSHWRSC
ncbi:hypothetical protein A0H81_06238 [Grifola frondosa]|uniref:Uncharacterized protein n=1 Tax=Grifola frondosa TaxID=5627 RepID=A0A1C7MA72_GRIFR|nr:hypothetical protein A0H81_06238 [Grifola frondosa]